MANQRLSGRVVSMLVLITTAACAADVYAPPPEVEARSEALEEVLVMASMDDGGGGFDSWGGGWGDWGGGWDFGWGSGPEIGDGSGGGGGDAETTASPSVAVELTPELATVMLAILHGTEAGQAAFDLAKASLDAGLRDINVYRQTGDHNMNAYTDKIVNWYQLNINWSNYGADTGISDEAVMAQYLQSVGH